MTHHMRWDDSVNRAFKLFICAIVLILVCLRICTSGEARSDSHGSAAARSALVCDVRMDTIKREGERPHLTVALINISSNDLYVRDMVPGYNLSICARKAADTNYWPIHPVGSYLEPGIKVIGPAREVVTRVQWPFGNEKYYLYCEFSSRESDTEVTWHGRARSALKCLRGGVLSEVK
jgi:hypothetical protein